MGSIGVVVPSVGQYTDAALDKDLTLEIEHLGYDSVWYGDHVAIPGYATSIVDPEWLEPIVRCAAGMGTTSTLRFGIEVLVAPYRNPVLTAKMLATAQRLGAGRLIPAFGVGYLKGEFEALGAPPHQFRGAVTDEYLHVIRGLLDSPGPYSHSGEHVRVNDISIGAAGAGMPLWVGGNGPAALRRAATAGDGWHPLFPTPEQYAQSRHRITELRADAQRSGEFTFSFSTCVARILDDPDGPYPTGTWSEMDGIPDDFTYAPPMPTDDSGRPYFMGTPDQVLDDVATYSAAGVDNFVLRFADGGPSTPPDAFVEQLRRFAEEVMPRLRD